MAIQDDNTILNKGDLKAYHEAIAPMLGGTLLSRTNVSDHYSTDEKVVGIWTDGKPIYQKTLELSGFSNGSNSFNHNISNFETLVGMKGIISRTDNCFQHYPHEDDQVSSYVVDNAVNATTVSVWFGSAARAALVSKIYLTIQYTKTTDTAGSGVTTPGAYDINFPNTWKENTEIYFGNGLYGQRFTGTITAAADTRAIVTLDASIINAKLVSQGGYWTDANDGNYPIGTYSAGTNSFYKMACITGGGSNDGIFLNQYSNVARSNSPYDVWVTYTK